MKKILALSLCCLVAAALSTTCRADTWNSDDGDFMTKSWKEMFKGGGPGQPGNTLMALGEGFHFKKATLESTYFDEIDQRWITTYVGGELLLNSRGPWLSRGKLLARDITATNSSAFNPDTGELDFVLTFSGQFENRPDVSFAVEARYLGVPEMEYDGDVPIFQRGYDFSATITVDGQ